MTVDAGDVSPGETSSSRVDAVGINADRAVLARAPTWVRLIWLGAWMQLPATLLPIWQVAGRSGVFRIRGSDGEPLLDTPWFRFDGSSGGAFAAVMAVAVLAAFASSLSIRPARRRVAQAVLLGWGALWSVSATRFALAGGASWFASLHVVLTVCAATRMLATWRVGAGSSEP